jgi:hypothetical protein
MEHKAAGNDAFKKQEYLNAAMHYSNALKEMPTEHTIYR